MRTPSERSRKAALGWILAAFAAVLAGAFAGAAVRDRDWTWAPLLAGFVAYVLAFRRGLSRGRDVDGIWREAQGSTPTNDLDRPAIPATEQTRPERSRLIRGEFVKLGRSDDSRGARISRPRDD